jgi:tetratricopeptide (TPR) repeat protein
VGTLHAADAPRIVGLSGAPPVVAQAAIREPAQDAAMQNDMPAAHLPRRSEFLPIALPDPIPPITQSPVPQLAQQPQFNVPPPAIESTAPAGPMLTSPTAPPVFAEQEPGTPTTRATPVSQQRVAPSPSVMPAVRNDAAIQAVVHRAMQKANQAASMAQRGMLYSARVELVQALQLIAHALDGQQTSATHASATHASALAAGLTAIEEARDFAASSSGPSEDHQVEAVAAGHRTRAFAPGEPVPTSPVAAQQRYLSLAQSQFLQAAGGVPAASQILYRLGRLETAMAAHDADPLALHGPQAIVFHQAALATDSANWLAANELGVLYARYGQLHEARQLLQASITAHPHVEGWQNLATVHRRLGETDLAKRAEHERQLLASKPNSASASAKAAVTLVDPKTFAASGAEDVTWPAGVANRAARK